MDMIKILSLWNRSEVHTLSWFKAKGYNQSQAYRSYKAGEIRKIGSGIYVRSYDPLHWAGAVQALQKETNLAVHIAGRSALELSGSAHNLSFQPTIELITYGAQRLPTWIKSNDWGVRFSFRHSRLFKSDLKNLSLSQHSLKESWLETHRESELEVIRASRELAILELIDQSIYENDFETTENYLTGLRSMRSSLIQSLMEHCTSVKVKRIFLYLSEKMEMPYFTKLDLKIIDLGSGKREIIKGGKWNSKYMITVERPIRENPF